MAFENVGSKGALSHGHAPEILPSAKKRRSMSISRGIIALALADGA